MANGTIAFNASAMEQVRAGQEREMKSLIGVMELQKNEYVGLALELEQQAAALEAKAAIQDSFARSAMMSETYTDIGGNMRTRSVPDMAKRARAVQEAGTLREQARSKRTQANALRRQIAALNTEIVKLRDTITQTNAYIRNLIELVQRTDLSYARQMDEINAATYAFNVRMKGICDSIDSVLSLSGSAFHSVMVKKDNVSDIIDIILKGVDRLDSSIDFAETLLRYSLANALNISIQASGKLYVVRQGSYTILKGAMNTGIGTRFLSSNLQAGKFPQAAKAVQSLKAQSALKTMGKVTLVAGGVIVAGKELFLENQDQSAARRVGNAGVEVGIYTASALAGLKVGAAAGAAIGSVIPVAGTAVGAVVGAVAGAAIGVIAGITASFLIDNAFNWIKVNEDQTLREWTKEKVGNATEGIAQGASKLYDSAKKGIGNAISGVSNFFRNPSVLWGG